MAFNLDRVVLCTTHDQFYVPRCLLLLFSSLVIDYMRDTVSCRRQSYSDQLMRLIEKKNTCLSSFPARENKSTGIGYIRRALPSTYLYTRL